MPSSNHQVEPEHNHCDCCLKSWNPNQPNEWGICQCWCSNCQKELNECKYTCYQLPECNIQ